MHTIEDPGRTEAIDRLDDLVPNDVLPRGGAFVLLWCGHGEPTPEGKLHLIAQDTRYGSAPLVTADTLASIAARTGAGQILLILDTCHSGQGILPATDVADRVLRELPPNAERVWIGVVGSAMDMERARDGTFGTRLLKLLRDGPGEPRAAAALECAQCGRAGR